MKRIKFKTNSISKFRILSILVAILLIVIGAGLFSIYSNGALVLLGFLIILFEISRLFWYRTYVQYKKSWIIIKLNTIVPRIIKFKEIEKLIVNKTQLKIILKSGKTYSFKLGWIERNDIDDLADIIVENSNAEYVNEGMHEDFYQKD